MLAGLTARLHMVLMGLGEVVVSVVVDKSCSVLLGESVCWCVCI